MIYAPSDGEMLGFFALVAAFFMGLGGLVFWGLPKLWGWIAPWLHAVTG